MPIDAFAEQAVELGIAEIAITDHIDFDPSAPAYRYSSFADRERVVRDAAERWAERGVAIRLGAEITWDGAWEADIRDYLRSHAYDFLIGSVHVYSGSPYDAAERPGLGRRQDAAEIVGPYFADVVAAARSELFDALGHIDVIKRYLLPYVTTADLAGAPELYEPMLRALIDSGTALEINTGGLRHEARETYPSPAIVARYRELGGRAVTVGSDAHRADTFAWGLAEAMRPRRRPASTAWPSAAEPTGWRCPSPPVLTRSRDVRCDPRRRRDRSAGRGGPGRGRLGVRPALRPLPPVGLSLHRQPRPPPVGRGGPDAAGLRQGPGSAPAL